MPRRAFSSEIPRPAFGDDNMLQGLKEALEEMKEDLEESRTIEASLRDQSTALEREVESYKSQARYVLLLFVIVSDLTQNSNTDREEVQGMSLLQ